MESHGWTIFFHACIVEQLKKVRQAAERAMAADSQGTETNSRVKFFRAVSHLILDVVPSAPSRAEYRQGKTLGWAHRHWRRAKIGRRFRIFFRYDSKSRIIVFAWINDENTLRSAGGKKDPYVVFRRMLKRGHPPEDWDKLMAASQSSDHDVPLDSRS